MAENSITWDGILDVALKTPGIKVNRTEFLSNAFKSFGDVSTIADNRPIDLFDEQTIEKVAKDVINGQTLKVTTISTVVGMPGGFAMLGTIPADMAQYYFHVLVVAQKLGYIYGWPDLQEEDGTISEGARNILTLFVGVMFGAQAANKALGEVAKRVAVQVAKRLPQKALTKTFLYPIVKQIAKWLGVKLTKDSFGKMVSKAIPIVGGLLSGGITLATFRPMANRLRDELRNEMSLFKSKDSHFYFDDFEEVPTDLSTGEFDELCITTCINIAKIDSEINEKEKVFILDMINSSTLTQEKKNLLEDKMQEKTLDDINFSSYEINNVYATALIENVLQMINVDDAMKPSEEIYLKKISKDLGISDEDLEEMILASRGV